MNLMILTQDRNRPIYGLLRMSLSKPIARNTPFALLALVKSVWKGVQSADGVGDVIRLLRSGLHRRPRGQCIRFCAVRHILLSWQGICYISDVAELRPREGAGQLPAFLQEIGDRHPTSSTCR